MDEDTINRPEPPGGLQDAGGVIGTSLLCAHEAEKLQTQWTSVARCHLLQGDGAGGMRSDCWQSVRFLASFNFCQNWLIGCFARFKVHVLLSPQILSFMGHPEKWVRLAFPGLSPLQNRPWGFAGGCVLVVGREQAGPGAPGSELGGLAACSLWAWAGPFSPLGLSLFLREMGCTHLLWMM